MIEDHSQAGHEVFVFVTLNGGSAVIELSADNVNFEAIDDGTLTEGGVKQLSTSVGSYLRVRYAGVTSVTATIQPKYSSNG